MEGDTLKASQCAPTRHRGMLRHEPRKMLAPLHERFALFGAKIVVLIYAKHAAEFVRDALLDHLNRHANASAAGDKGAAEVMEAKRLIELHVKAIFGAHVRTYGAQAVAKYIRTATRQRLNDRAHERRQ